MKVNTGEKLGFELFHICKAMKWLNVASLEVERYLTDEGKGMFEFNFDHRLRSHRVPCSWGLKVQKFHLDSGYSMDEQWPSYATMTLEEAVSSLADAILNDEPQHNGHLAGTLIIHTNGTLEIKESERYTVHRSHSYLITSDQVENESGLKRRIDKVVERFGAWRSGAASGKEETVDLRDVEIPIYYFRYGHQVSSEGYRSIEVDDLAETLLEGIRIQHDAQREDEVNFSGRILVRFDGNGKASIHIETTIDDTAEVVVNDRMRPFDSLREGEEEGDLLRHHTQGEMTFCDSFRLIAEKNAVVIKKGKEEISRIKHETMEALRFALDLDGISENAIIVPSLDESLRIRFLEDRIEVATIDTVKATLPYSEIGVDAKYMPAILSLQLSTFIRHKAYEAIESFLRRNIPATPILLDVLKSKSDELKDARLLSLHEAYRMSQAVQGNREKRAINPQVRRPQI